MIDKIVCHEVVVVNKFTCLVDRVSASGGCEDAVTERIRCGWAKFMACGKLPYG